MFSNYCLIFTITKIVHLFLSFPIQYAIKNHAKNQYYFLDFVELLFCFINLDKQSCRQHKVPSQNIYFNLENNNTNTYNARHNTDSVIFTTKYNEWYKLIQRFTSWYRA